LDDDRGGDVGTTQAPGVTALLGDLAGAALDIAHNTVQLVACESRLVVRRLAMRAGVFIVGLVFAAMGLLLVLVGGALLLAQAADLPPWAAIALVGVVVLAAGAIAAKSALHKLGEPDIAFPGTLAEFKKDVEALRRRDLE
jgi:uncharacterized membrane protein YqjE